MLAEYLFISLIIQIVFFVPAYRFKTDKLTDLSYGLTFIILSIIAFLRNTASLSKLLLLLMVIVWGLRLATYLFIRINKIKKDSRFDEIRIYFFKFLSFWFIQGATVFIVLLPTLIYFNIETGFSLITFIGFFVWLVGFLIEAVSDQQKFTFINNIKNKGKWVNVGLWKYSRHPNYLGEILCWVGIYLYTFNSFSLSYKLIGFFSPLFIILLLLFVSGIPKLEKKADGKWGNNKDYREYKKKTAVLIPLIY